jgi:hypothetical protein
MNECEENHTHLQIPYANGCVPPEKRQYDFRRKSYADVLGERIDIPRADAPKLKKPVSIMIQKIKEQLTREVQ